MSIAKGKGYANIVHLEVVYYKYKVHLFLCPCFFPFFFSVLIRSQNTFLFKGWIVLSVVSSRASYSKRPDVDGFDTTSCFLYEWSVKIEKKKVGRSYIPARGRCCLP